MLAPQQEHSDNPIGAGLRVGLKSFSWTVRYVGTWYVANAGWALLDLADRDPSGILAWTDLNKLAGVFLLRHLFPLIKTNPLLGILTLILALVAGRLLHILAGRFGSQDCAQTIGQVEAEFSNSLQELSERVDQLEKDINDCTVT